jgi:SAM-dependent methyltransferase
VLTISTNRSLYTHYLKGRGIEIGALDAPLVIVHDNVKVMYVDRKTKEDLRKQHPNRKDFVDVDILSSAEDLNEIEDNSLDFMIANHVIEHLANPIKTLGLWSSKLKPDGILFLAFPEASRCPDKIRKLTPLSHLIKDYTGDNREANDEHLLGFAYAWNPAYFKAPEEIGQVLNHMWDNNLEHLTEELETMIMENRECVQRLLTDRSKEVHHHIFNYHSMKAVFEYLFSHLPFKYRLVDLSMTKYYLNEHIFILQKVHKGHRFFLDEFAKTSEEKEKFLEWFLQEGADLIQKQNDTLQEQRKFLDQRYQIIEDQRSISNQRSDIIQEQRALLDQRYQIIEGQRMVLEQEYEIIRGLTEAINAKSPIG